MERESKKPTLKNKLEIINLFLDPNCLKYLETHYKNEYLHRFLKRFVFLANNFQLDELDKLIFFF